MKTRITANQTKSNRWMFLGVGFSLALGLLLFCYFAFVTTNVRNYAVTPVAEEASVPVYGLEDVTPVPTATAENPLPDLDVVAPAETEDESESSTAISAPVDITKPTLPVNILSQNTSWPSNALPFEPADIIEQARNQVQITDDGIPYVEQTAHQGEFTEDSLVFTALAETPPASDDLSDVVIPDLAVSPAITVQLTSIALGTTTLTDAPAQSVPDVQGNVVRYARGQGVIEEFIAGDTGIEQRWWLESKPRATGDLVIVVDVQTALTLEPTNEGFLFQTVDRITGQTIPVIQYARPQALDANQQTLWGQTDSRLIATSEEGLNHYQLTLSFPADWLANAQYPLLIDPLVSGLLRLEQGSPAQSQQNIQMAYNPDDNEFLLVWQDYRNANNWDIYGQRLDGDGALLGDNFVIKAASYHQDMPQVAYAPGGDKYLATWRHYTSATQYDVYGQLLSGTGEFVGSAFAIATGPASTLQTPTDIAYNSQSSQFLVLWEDGRSTYTNIWGRHVSLTGSLGAEIQITTSTTFHQRAASAAYNAATEQYLVVWATTDNKILARRVTGAGVVITTDNILLGSNLNVGINLPDVVYLDSTAQYLTVWQDNRNAGTSGLDIYGRLVTPAGSTNGSEFVISNHSANETLPRLTLSTSGGAWVVWQRNNGLTTGQDLYARELNGNAQLIGTTLTIYENVYTPGMDMGLNQERPVVTLNSLGDLVFVWQDNRTGNWDIYARLRLANGDIGGDFLTHPASGNQENVHIAFNTSANEYLVVWQDFRNDLVGWQIYGQRVSGSGSLMGDNIVINSAGIEPDVAYSSTSNQYLVVWTYNNTIQGQRITAAGALSGSAYLVIPDLQKGSLADQPAVVYNPTTNLFLVASRVRVPGMSTVHKILTRQTPGLYSNVELVSQTNLAIAEPDVAVASDGSYLVVWQDPRNGTYDIYGRRLTSAGATNGNDFGIRTTGTTQGWYEMSPDVAWNSTASTFLVVWESYFAGTPPSQLSLIEGQRLNTNGTLIGAVLVLAATDGAIGDFDYVSNPGVTASDGKWLVVWQDARSASTLADVKAVTIQADGVLLGGQTIPLVVAAGSQYNPVVVGGNLDYALLAWQDNREGSWDLYAALYQMDVAVSGLTATNNSPTVLGNTTFLTATIVTGTNVVYTWAFGDNTTGSGATPNHTYAQPGVYTAIVTATNSDNLLTASTVVTIYHPAVADFVGTPVSGTVPLSVTFTNSSTFATGYLWQFGDGATSNVVSPVHVYTQPGTYTVSLIAIGLYNTSVLTRSAYIMATDVPVTGLTAVNSSPILLGSTTFFTATITAGTNVSYTWDFGDNTISTGATPNHIYAQPGIYTATVTATNSANSLMATTVVTIYQPVVADFVGTPVSGTVPLSVTFTNSSTFATSYQWQFGDGATSTTISPTHVYTQTGIYTVTLWASTLYSSDVLTRSAYITVFDNNPSAILVKEGPAIVEAGDPITYTLTVTNNGQYNLSNLLITDTLPVGASYISGGTLVGQTVQWGFPSLAAGHSLSVTFVITANSVVINDRYAVTANGGLYATGEPVITVIGEPWGGYWWDDTFFYRRPLTLTTSNVILSGPGITHTVAFTIATSTLISDGRLQVDGDDIRMLYRDVLGWHLLPTQVSSVVSPTAVITFSLASGLPDTAGTYWLYYGNAVAGPGPELETSDATAGQVITGVIGTGTITPTVSFFADPRLAWVGQSISFTNYVTPVAVIDTFTWSFGDNITSTISNTNHAYTAPGVYTVTLTVTTTEGLAVTYGYTNYITILDDQSSGVTITVGSEEEPVVITTLQAGQAGEAQSAMGDFFVAFPAGAITQTLIITHTPFQAEVQQNVGVMKRFALDAATTTGEVVTQFGQPLQLVLDLTAWNMTPEDMATVVLFYWDETENEWVALPTTVDTVHGVALARTDHFSEFAAASNYGLGGPPALRRLPSVSEGGVDLLTGSSTYVYPLEVPPGTHGMQPNLSLVYNSGAADTLLDQQAGIVGHGFELAGLGWIQYDPDSNAYYLNLNGVSEKLITSGSSNIFHTEHETYWHIERLVGGENGVSGGSTWEEGEYWVVTTQDGTQYRFGFYPDSSSYYVVGNESPTYANIVSRVYRFNLDRIQDVYDNTVLINYDEDGKLIFAYGIPYGYETSAWPEAIYYTENATTGLQPSRVINFVYDQPGVTNDDGTRVDFPENMSDVGPGANYGYPSALAEITMSVNNQAVRTYEFQYRYFTQEGEEPSGYGPDRYHLMLTDITEKGTDDSTLPSTVFTYTQTGHLYRIENGYGGRVTYTYHKIEDWTQNFYHFEHYETCLLSIFCKNRQPDTDRWRVVGRRIEDVSSGQNHLFGYFYEGTLFQGYNFRGHQKVTVLDPEGLATTTYFSLGEYNAYSSAIPYARSILWGKPYEVIAREGGVYTMLHRYNTYGISYGIPGVADRIVSQCNETYMGSGTPLASCVYFDQYGNVERTVEKDINEYGDDRETIVTYETPPASYYIINRPRTITITVDGNMVGLTTFAYEVANTQSYPVSQLTEIRVDLGYGDSGTNITLFDGVGNVTDVYQGLTAPPTTFVYDPVYQTFLMETNFPLGLQESYEFDVRFGAMTAITDVNGLTIRYDHDPFGRVLSETGGSFGPVAYTYVESSSGMQVIVKNLGSSQPNDDHYTYLFYDGLGQLARELRPDGSGNLNVKTRYGYDGLGRLITTTIPYTGSTPIRTLYTTYDPLGRPLTVESLDGITEYNYPDWSTTIVEDASGDQKLYEIDPLGRVIRVVEYDDLGTPLTTTYDYLDNSISVLTISDAQDNPTYVYFDMLGRKRGVNDPNMGYWQYTYNDLGQLETQTDERDVVTTLLYDSLGRVTDKNYTIPAESGVASTESVIYGYEGGLLTSMQDGSGQTTWEHDTAGRVLTETKVIDGQVFVTLYRYDGFGRLANMTYPDGEVVTYSYNFVGQVQSMTGQDNYLVNADYNLLGQPQIWTLGNGVVQQITYDDWDSFRPQFITSTNASSTHLQRIALLYDDLGRLYHWADNLPGQSLILYSSYDSLSRLAHVDASIDTFDQDYEYDTIGNLITRTGYVNQVFNQGSFIRPHLPESDANGTTYIYDANGNLVRREMQSGQVISYTYNAENYLTQVVSRTGTVSVETTFSYDGNGQRVARVPNNGHVQVFIGDYFEGQPATGGGTTNISNSTAHSTSPCLALGANEMPYFVWSEDGEIWFKSLYGASAVNLSNTASQSIQPVVATYINGSAATIHVVWFENGTTYEDRVLFYIYSTDGGTTWSQPQDVTSDFRYLPDPNPAQWEHVKGEPHLVVDTDGTVHLVWTQLVNRDSDNTSVVLVHRWSAQGVWSSQNITILTEIYEFGFSQDKGVDIIADSTNGLHLVLSNKGDSFGGDIYYRQWVDGSWSSEILVSETTPPIYVKPSVAVESDGTVHVAWLRNDATLLYRYKPSGSPTWSGTEVVETDVIMWPDLAVSPSDNVFLVFGQVSDGLQYVKREGNDWSEPTIVSTSVDLLTGGYPCRIEAGIYGPHITYNDIVGGYLDVFYYGGEQSGDVTKRYFAGGQQVATRVDGELFYHLNDPSGSSLTMVDETGTQHWQVVYDGYGMVLTTLTNTLPITHTWMQTLFGVLDATSNLVYQGNGRYYDPALGRPLQPNPSGAPPTVPQALNRYTATSLGQPGVFQSTQSSLITQLLESSRNQVPGLLAGPPATALAIHRWAETVYKSVPSGFGIVQLEGTVRSLRFLGDSFDYSPMRLANGFPRRVISRLFKGFRLQTATGRRYVGDTAQELVEFQERMAQRGISASLLSREFDEVVDAAATSASRNIAKGWGGVLGVGIGGLLNVGIQYAYDYDNPYLTGWQKAQRAGVSGTAGGAAGVAGLYAAGLWGGPVGVGVAFTIGVILELEVVPRIFEFVGIIPTRDLHAMTTP